MIDSIDPRSVPGRVEGEGRGAQSVPQGADQALADSARRLDIMSKMTRLLLDEESLAESVALRRSADLLAAEFADWAIIDVLRDGETCRAVVAGAGGETSGVRMLEGRDPAATLSGQVLESGIPEVHPSIDDVSVFGRDSRGRPVLTALGADSLVCVPLRDRRGALGALTLLRRGAWRRFSAADLTLVEEIADHLALALRAERRYQRRSHAADTLQASLLPRALPAVPGLELGAAYRPATDGLDVGGDFYDVFETGDGWGFVLGDVCGKGEEAAAVTAMVRHSVRLLSLWHTESEVFRRVNHAMRVHRETERFVSVVAVRVEWRAGAPRVRIASAGHPRLAVLSADGDVRLASGGGTVLGVMRDTAVACEEMSPRPGDTLVLYSDGVTETRSPAGALYGERRLADTLARARGLAPPQLVKAIEDDLHAYGGGRNSDDVALLALRLGAAV